MSFFENEIEHWRKIIARVKKEKKLMKLVIAYFVIAFLSFDFLFGIAKQPFRDINTLNASDRTEFLKVTKEYRANQEKIFKWERLDHISGYDDPDVPIIIKKLKKENTKLDKKRRQLYAKADYKAWQYRFSKFIGWQYPFNLHKH